MSLVVWLPLTKDLRQQGLSSMTVENHNATLNTAGKLGSCYYFNGSQQWLQFDTVLGDYYNNDWSIACWLKPTDSTRSVIISEYSSTGASNVGLELTASRVVRLYWNGSPDINFTTAGALPINEWTHLTVTKQARVVKVYFNGELKQTYTNSSDFSTRTSASYPRIGDDYRGNSSSTVSYQGYINDFRMYDHCLSPMEVKELAKGLVLHYPLNRQGWGQENFYTGNGIGALSNTSSVSNNGYESTFVLSAQGGVRASNLGFNGKTGPWTASFDIKSSVNTTITIDICDRGYNTATYGTSLTKDVWIHKSFIVTTATNQYNVSGNYNGFIDFNCGAAGTYNIKNLKVEEGIIETPWCPSSNHALATTMGLNSTTEYDSSGFCNNGTWHGTHTNTSDTSKYAVSTTATGSGTTYLEGPVLPAEAKTVALWIKNTSKSSNGAIFNDKTSGLQIGLLNSLLYMNSAASTAGFTTTHWVNGEWNHVVAVNNNGTRSLYVNGQAETQSGASNYYIHNADNCWLWNRSYNNNYPFTGSLCDLRVYATALSADDVKSLYQNSAYIDSSGNVYGAIHTEV